MLKSVVWMSVTAAAIAVASPGCKNKDNGPRGADAKPIDVGPINAAIPAAWKGKIEFVVGKVGKGDKFNAAVDGAIPKGWQPAFLSDSIKPGEGDHTFGFSTSMRVGAGCGGECKGKSSAEYIKISNHEFFDNMLEHKPAPKILKDEQVPGRRTMIAEDQATDGNVNQTSVIVATWVDGADHYYYCDVDLEPEVKELAPVFERACLAAIAP